MANPSLGVKSAMKSGGLKELKSRFIFLLVAILVFRLGSYIPVPGVDPVKLAHMFQQHSGGIFSLFNMFSGGALRRFTVFALSVMPYISASIIVQLFTSIIPSLEQLKKEGESGQRKINQYTRYGTVVLAAFQALGISKMLSASGVVIDPGSAFYVTATITLVTGTLFLMWLGEQVTEYGIGNGVSMIIFANIISGLPGALGRVLVQVRQGQMEMLTLLLIVALIVVVTAVVVFVERGQRRIKINYPQRQQGRRMYAAQSTHLPLKINMSGVIPPIFASAIILFPGSMLQWFGHSASGTTWLGDLANLLQPGTPLYMILYSVAILFFCFFYTAVVFNPQETADNLKRSGAFVPGIRPGQQTAKYIDLVMSRLTLFGAIYLILICLLPQILMDSFNVPFFFGGTSLLIVVVVVMDFMAQVQSHLMSQQYSSLMRKANLKGKNKK
ncbi:MAG: preprotein translocase subunit SecY [Gammaproteobacteria bacterium CG11_big_fil_rev_8_21_14_0_20_46_22]|nr:MAG: preprotein translocase subunit SecY [Gammaproteobacteria bacterium CG12_big_fil_rev_8_21_14_0_65_46_12]PIR11327.1 MAG: preprotein translocase subunit SecY [Gammaproteobacteria bacterium CG11_big_fil_rev_8_21_14_0_20_46_22]